MQVELTHPQTTVKNRVEIQLSDEDLEDIRLLERDEFLSYLLGYNLVIIVRKEKSDGGN